MIINVSKLRKKLCRYFGIILALITVSILLRILLLEIYTVPSNSMENTILPGDKIIANKLAYGARMPQSVYEVPWINIAYYITHRNRLGQPPKWKHLRLKGFSEVKHGDIVFFDPPMANNPDVFIKRCVGLPGDTLQLMQSKLYINNACIDESLLAQHRYKIYASNNDEIIDFKNKNGLHIWRKANANYLVGSLTDFDKNTIETTFTPDSITDFNPGQKMAESLFPSYEFTHWTTDDYGPIVIPKKGMTIKMDSASYMYYKKLFRLYEKVDIEIANKQFKKAGIPITHYTFKHNYYWMMGDNRHFSLDSRKWGFVPEENIIAKAGRVIFSYEKKKFKWKRTLKKLN